PADGKGPHNWSPTQKDVAFSLELAYELERAFVAVGGIATGADRPMYQMYSARMGWSLLPGAMTPYLALGAGYLWQASESTAPCYDMECSSVTATGAAVVAEAGALFGRNLRFGRVALTAQFIKPLFSLSLSSCSGV